MKITNQCNYHLPPRISKVNFCAIPTRFKDLPQFNITNSRLWETLLVESEKERTGEKRLSLEIAAIWANKMEELLGNGSRLEDIAEQAKPYRDTYTLSFFDNVVDHLSYVWEHGLELQRIYAKKAQDERAKLLFTRRF